jgi:DNA-binding MarR family transcriptional regulator
MLAVVMKAGFQLGEFLPFRFSRLTERMSRSLAGVYADRFDLSVAQWRVLATLNETPGLTAKVVAERCNLDKVKVSRAVSGLEQRQLLTRRKDARDARASELRLAPKGQRMFRAITPLALQWENEFRNLLTVDEQRSLLQILARLELQMTNEEKAASIAAVTESS